MADLYISDVTASLDLIQLDNSTAPRTADDIKTLISHIIQKQPSNCTKVSQKGFIVSFTEDKDINCIFPLENQRLLQAKNLKAELAKKTAINREAFLRNTPSYIFNKTDSQILSEIQTKNHIKLLHLNKFEVTKEARTTRYLVLTLESKQARDRVISYTTINLFGTNLFAQAKHSRSSHRERTTQEASPHTYTTTSAHHLGQALPTDSSWAGQRTHPPQPNINTKTVLHRPATLHQQKPQQQTPAIYTSHQHQDTADAGLYRTLEITSIVSKTLSSGLENPKEYLSIFNEALQQKGITPICMPISAFILSKKLYSKENIVTPTTHIPKSTTNSHHTPKSSTNSHHTPTTTTTLTTVQSTTPSNLTSPIQTPTTTPPITTTSTSHLRPVTSTLTPQTPHTINTPQTLLTINTSACNTIPYTSTPYTNPNPITQSNHTTLAPTSPPHHHHNPPTTSYSTPHNRHNPLSFFTALAATPNTQTHLFQNHLFQHLPFPNPHTNSPIHATSNPTYTHTLFDLDTQTVNTTSEY